MTTFLLTGLSNAAAAGLLAVVAYLVGRRCHSPALAHSLWLLVLIKLVTPPLLPIPIAFVDLDSPFQETLAAPRSAAPPVPLEQAVPAPMAPQKASPAEPQTRIAEISPPAAYIGSKLDPKTGRPLPPAIEKTEPKPASYRLTDGIEPDDENDGVASGSSNSIGRSVTDGGTAEALPPPPHPFPWQRFLLLTWLTGSIVCLVIACRRIRQFQGLLALGWEAPEPLRREFHEIALDLGLRRAPRLRLLPGPVTPMLWAVGRVTIYFPAELCRLLDAEQRRALLVHELAHVKRRDHWVRWLEMVAAIAFWWLPFRSLTCRELRRAEEECCDAWVVHALPGAEVRYAAALVDTIDFLSNDTRIPTPVCGIGRVSCLQERLRSILHGTPSRRLSVTQQVALIAFACLVLPVTPVIGHVYKPASRPELRPAADVKTNSRPEPTVFREQASAFAPQLTQNPIIFALAFSPDSRSIAVGTENNIIALWRRAQSAGPRLFTGHSDSIAGLAFSPDGNTLASASYDKTIKLWDTSTGACLQTLTGHRKWVFAVAFSPDGKRLASASYDRTIRVWNLRTLDVEAELRGHIGGVRAVAFSPDGKLLVSGGADHTVRLWSLDDERDPIILRGHRGPVRSVAFHPDGHTIASGGENLRVWDVGTKAQCADSGAGADRIGCLAFSPSGTTIAAGMWSGRVRVLEAERLKPQCECRGPSEAITTIAISPDGRRITAAGYDRLVFSWLPVK